MSIFDTVTSKGKKYIDDKYGVNVPDMSKSYERLESLFSIRDVVCEEYNPPFVSKNMKTAIRSIRESIKGSQTLISMHPEDYILEHIGYFDKNLGTVCPVEFTNRERYPLTKLFIASDKDCNVDNVISEVNADEIQNK